MCEGEWKRGVGSGWGERGMRGGREEGVEIWGVDYQQ